PVVLVAIKRLWITFICELNTITIKAAQISTAILMAAHQPKKLVTVAKSNMMHAPACALVAQYYFTASAIQSAKPSGTISSCCARVHAVYRLENKRARLS